MKLRHQGESLATVLEAGQGLGDGHQPAQAQPRFGRDRRRQVWHLARRAPRLAFLAIGVDLYQHVKRVQLGRPIRRERRHQLGAVHGLHPVEMLRGLASLVRLQMAYQVPLQSASAEGADLGQRLLHVVLAEGALSGIGQAGDRFGGLHLRYRQQARRWPAGPPGRVLHFFQ